MAYKALYRTYRPENFEDMAGQKYIIKTLENAVNNDKIAHAYLFCGPRGTGKTSAAKIFAKAVNCEGEVKPCGMCESCKSADAGIHPDIIEIDAASNNGVEEVRNLIDKVKYAPIKGKYKVYIIDEVHMMSQGAYNALLKTIEEPPAHVIFILATTEPYKVLPTIISRCQRFDFKKISREEIETRLAYVCNKEKITYEEAALQTIAELADGGMRDALSILDQCYAYTPDHIQRKDVYEIYGIVTTKEKLEILTYIRNKNTADLMNKINQVDQKGIDIKRLTSDLVEILKEKVIYDYTKNEDMLSILSVGEAKNLSEMSTASESLQMIDVLMDSYDKYRNASNALSYLEIALLKMMEIVSRETMVEPVVIKEQSVDEEIRTKDSEEDKRQIIEEPEIIVEDMQVILPIEDSVMDQEENSNILKVADVEEISESMEEIVETIDQITEAMPEVKVFKTLEDDFVLRLLVGANKKEKEEDREQMKGLGEYKLDIEYAKYASLLDANDIVASGNTFLVVCTNSQALANEINELDKNNEFLSFIDMLMKKRKKVFAISNVQYERVVDLFRMKQRINALPDPIDFVIEAEKEEKSETMEALNILFGKNIDIKEE